VSPGKALLYVKIEALKKMVRAMGMNAEQVLNREALTEPAATASAQNHYRTISAKSSLGLPKN